MSFQAIILAAGKSKRMKSHRPKAMHEICGRPMLHYVLQACFEAGCDRVIVVVGVGKDEIITHFGGDKRIHFVEQTEQLGTGHAARMAEAELKKHHGDVLILTGDGPLIRGQVLKTLHQAHKDERAAATMATGMLEDPTGYGRIVRSEAGEFLDIVEQADCSAEQREIREVFPSIYCLKSDELLWALAQLKPNNKQGEYYLTDVFGHLRRAGKKVVAVQAVTAEDMLGVNTRQQQAEVDAIMQDRIQARLREAGVTIVNSYSTYIQDGVNIGPDSTVYPFTFIGRDASIGAGCTIGPFASVPLESILPEGTTFSGNVSVDSVLGTKSGS